MTSNTSEVWPGRGSGISRRAFLIGSGAVATVVAIPWAGLASAPSAVAAPGDGLFAGGYPHWFAFRRAEALANSGSDYDAWAANFTLAGGIEGKCLSEEQPTATHNPAWFTQFKQDNPGKMVLLHFNGRARLPGFDNAQSWYPGVWMYRPWTTLTAAAEADDTQLQIADTSHITASESGPYNSSSTGSDVCIASVCIDGTPDFTNVEYVKVAGLDGAGNMIFCRGMYGTVAKAWPAGSKVAAHCVAGPIAGAVLWIQNYSTQAPLDPNGNSVADYVIDDLVSHLGPGGDLATLDGVELDVLTFTAPSVQYPDCDNDGIQDNGQDAAGVNQHGVGVTNFVSRLRAALPADKHLVVDGGPTQHANTVINGIELEGFPTVGDAGTFALWSQSLNILEFYERFSAADHISYPLVKWNDQPSATEACRRVRLSLAASVLTGVPFSYAMLPNDANGTFHIWDELVAGASQTPNWMGNPVVAPGATTTEMVRTAESTTDLLNGDGVNLPDSYVSSLTLDGLTVTKLVQAGTLNRLLFQHVTTSSTTQPKVTVPPVTTTSSDLFISFEVKPDQLTNYVQATVPRIVTVTVTGPNGTHTQTGYGIASNFNWLHLGFRDVGTGTVTITISAEATPTDDSNNPIDCPDWRLRNLRIFSAPDVTYRLFEHGLVVVNMSSSSQDFDLSPFSGGLTRLTATTGQDPNTNNGETVSGTLQIPPVDALFLLRNGLAGPDQPAHRRRRDQPVHRHGRR